MNKRFFQPFVVCIFFSAAGLAAAAESKPALQVAPAAARAAAPFLSWDTEGGGRQQTNLLRAGTAVHLRFKQDGGWRSSAEMAAHVQTISRGGASYRISGPGAELTWRVEARGASLRLAFWSRAQRPDRAPALELVFPFDPRVTPTTVLPAAWEAEGALRLPAVVNAPDFGPMLLVAAPARVSQLKGRLEGSRANKTVDFILELPFPQPGEIITLELKPLGLPPPKGLRDTAQWRLARRGWLNALQPSARWGEQGRPFSAPAGILANNVVSDPATCSLWFYADQAFWMPEISPGISTAALVRHSLDWWLDHRVRPDGEMVCYWDFGGFLDANAGPLIAAWDYVESSGDTAWLKRRIERLEFIADFLAQRDTDGDGLVEAKQSGNRNSLHEPSRSCAWWDALNCGHKDAYTNGLIYRAWRCLADLEAKLRRRDKQARYTLLADRLKAAYAKTLFNPRTGWLAWWKSADGELHDYAAPTVNGLAIEYGLVEPAQGREILARLRRKMAEVGFSRFDLGVPPMLVPVPPSDYLQPDAIGIPRREDGTDTFGQYMNGGITAGHVLHFLAAHYVVGEPAEADRILRAMLARQQRGEFQNGVRDKGGQGIDWTTWDGRPSGYEGYLADSFRFLQAVLLREPTFRARLYRPLLTAIRRLHR